MCGRYALTSPPEAIRQLFGYAETPNFPPRYNIAPTQPIPVVIVEQDVAMAKRVSKRLYCFQEGLVSLQGHSESLTQEAISQAYFGV